MNSFMFLQAAGLVQRLGEFFADDAVQTVARPEVAIGFLLLWLLFRRKKAEPVDRQAGIRDRYEKGEISKEMYDDIVSGRHEAER